MVAPRVTLDEEKELDIDSLLERGELEAEKMEKALDEKMKEFIDKQ
jgi:hypothetical protein